MKWWWSWWVRSSREAKVRAEQAEAELRRVQKLTPRIESLANEMQVLPTEEFADRMTRAFQPRRRLQ